MNLDTNFAINQPVTSKMSALGAAKNLNPEQAKTVAKDFEALFISQMVEQMFGESEGSEAFGSEETDSVYKSLMVQEYGKTITRSGGIGIADYVERELLKQQEVKE